jgi:adenylosuccinate synthase
MEIKAVIGANYGDEGKGLVTNFLARKAISENKCPIVVLNNGGAQRGHTVIVGHNKHIFHHFGSGTMQGAATYIADKFILNPIVFVNEYQELCELGYTPRITADYKCLVSTPYEMLCSQIVCDFLGINDTCGLGIWETVKQFEEDNDAIHDYYWYDCRLKNQKGIDEIKEYLKHKREDLTRLVVSILESKDKLDSDSKIDILKTIVEHTAKINIEGLHEHWISDLRNMIDIFNKNVDITYKLMENPTVIIVENGQGILLDRFKDKRYGTPSRTGAEGVCDFISNYFLSTQIKKATVELVYVSRPYITRHGDGPLDNIIEDNNIISMLASRDTTNVPNDYQGTMRFARLDINELFGRVLEDYREGLKNSIALSAVPMRYSFTLAFTHIEDVELFKTIPYNMIVEPCKEFYRGFDNKTKFISTFMYMITSKSYGDLPTVVSLL